MLSPQPGRPCVDQGFAPELRQQPPRPESSRAGGSGSSSSSHWARGPRSLAPLWMQKWRAGTRDLRGYTQALLPWPLLGDGPSISKTPGPRCPPFFPGRLSDWAYSGRASLLLAGSLWVHPACTGQSSVLLQVQVHRDSGLWAAGYVRLIEAL